MPDLPISESPPFLTEVRGSISKLTSCKAARICGILAELLKAGGEPMARGLHAAIWQSGTVPPNLLWGVVIPLWKGKGDRWDCSNYRDITLLIIRGKVLVYILLRRIRDHLLRHQRLEQSGFTPGRATVQGPCGATLGNIKVTDLDFTDAAILSESLKSLVVALDAFSNEAKPLGLEVSRTKTKIQDFRTLGEPVQSVHACGEDSEVTESFTWKLKPGHYPVPWSHILMHHAGSWSTVSGTTC
ncbi:uncharacterized protein [Penaeus vannamei]|uniref:uncharacterized protein n=1 Tax=Penaeus vannamei TaxID=6689 RepID=UPI00387F5738